MFFVQHAIFFYVAIFITIVTLNWLTIVAFTFFTRLILGVVVFIWTSTTSPTLSTSTIHERNVLQASLLLLLNSLPFPHVLCLENYNIVWNAFSIYVFSYLFNLSSWDWREPSNTSMVSTLKFLNSSIASYNHMIMFFRQVYQKNFNQFSLDI